MTGVTIFAAIALLLLLLLLRVARRRREPSHISAAPLAEKMQPLEELKPFHCRYFPQVRQAISRDDQEFLRRAASATIRHTVTAERRRVVRLFLSGLREDFLRVDRLGRTVASLSPRVDRKEELERLWLGFRFRGLYRLVRLRLAVGGTPLPQLERLAGLVGSLAAKTERMMTALEERSPARIHSSFNV